MMLMHKAHMIRLIESEIAQVTGRAYRIKLDNLDEESLREVIRLIRDLRQDKQAAVYRARITPWRR
jgi:phosphoserine phosphatase